LAVRTLRVRHRVRWELPGPQARRAPPQRWVELRSRVQLAPVERPVLDPDLSRHLVVLVVRQAQWPTSLSTAHRDGSGQMPERQSTGWSRQGHIVSL